LQQDQQEQQHEGQHEGQQQQGVQDVPEAGQGMSKAEAAAAASEAWWNRAPGEWAPHERLLAAGR
jgi:hypothetical protein